MLVTIYLNGAKVNKQLKYKAYKKESDLKYTGDSFEKKTTFK